MGPLFLQWSGLGSGEPCTWVECSVAIILRFSILPLDVCFVKEVQGEQWSLGQGFGAFSDAPSCLPPHPSHRLLLCSLPAHPSKLLPRTVPTPWPSACRTPTPCNTGWGNKWIMAAGRGPSSAAAGCSPLRVGARTSMQESSVGCMRPSASWGGADGSGSSLG